MIGRRGFIGALAGLPIAAVVQPRVSVPEVTAPPLPAMQTIGYCHTDLQTRTDQQVTVTIHCDRRPL